MKKTTEKSNVSYEEALQELEEIREALEDDLISVDLLSIKVSRAYQLIELCKKKLLKTESELEGFTKED